MATLHILDDGTLSVTFDTVAFSNPPGKGCDWHPADGQLWCHINDADLKFTLNRIVNNIELAPWHDPKTARKDVLKGMLRNFIYASGLLLALAGVYHLP